MTVCTIVGMGPGLGYAIARRFGKAGFGIGMIARSTERLAAVAEDLDSESITCAGVTADAGSEPALRDALAQLRGRLGDPQILVYNAFTDHRLAPTRLPLEDAIADFRVNVGGALVAAQVVAPAMLGRGNSAILMTGGGFALQPAVERSSLALDKAALRNLVMSLALELEPKGVRVGTVTVCGQIRPDTAFSSERIAEEFFAMSQEKPGSPNERQFRG
jgi:short-subunit dehydrogenase